MRQSTPERVVLGLMSGTSVDGIDAAAVALREEGERLHARLLHYAEAPYPPALRERIHALFDPERGTVPDVCEVNVLVGEAFAEAARAAIAARGQPVDLIASHGQTIWHRPHPARLPAPTSRTPPTSNGENPRPPTSSSSVSTAASRRASSVRRHRSSQPLRTPGTPTPAPPVADPRE